MEPMKLEDKIILGGEETTIKKLKAGKFYEAQKVFSEILSVSTGAGAEDGSNMSKLMTEFPELITKFVAVCSEIPVDEINEKAYPEEISAAFGVCAELNNVVENIKNSVAPMEKLMMGASQAKK